MRFENKWRSGEAKRKSRKRGLFQMVGDTRGKSFCNSCSLSIIRHREMTGVIWREKQEEGRGIHGNGVGKGQKVNKEMNEGLWQLPL